MTQSTPTRPGLLHGFVDMFTNIAVPNNEPPKVVLRRRIVVAVVIVVGAAVLGFSLTRQPGESAFYWSTLTLAAVWVVGALVSGPMHLGFVRFRGRYARPVLIGAGIGLALGVVFVLGALIVREIPALSDLVSRVLAFANDDSALRFIVVITLVNAIAEEMFFRGALYTAIGRHHPLVISTVLYIAATMASGNPMLGFAALILGAVCATERRATGGVLAPLLTHLVWGLIMVLALPPLFGV
ncbi:MAG: type II CAAX endopeptidase family protein [Mycobacterium sp.]